MTINTDSVTNGLEYLDLALSELKKGLTNITNGKSSCPYNVPYQEVIDQVNYLITMCTDEINACNNFNDQVTLDDKIIDSILNPEGENSDNSETPEVLYPNYDMIAKKPGSLLGEKGNSKTSFMSIKEGYLFKVIDSGDPDDPYALVICYRADGKPGHVGYVKKDCLEETGGDSKLGFTVEETGGFARVNERGVRVRETPGGDVLTTADKGTYVHVIGYTPVPDYDNEKAWYIVSYRNSEGKIETGFMREDMLDWYDSEEDMRQAYSKESDRALVTGDKVRLRSSDTTEADNIIDKLDKDAEVVILEETPEWYRVRYKQKEGFISKQYVKRQEPRSTPKELDGYTFEGN